MCPELRLLTTSKIQPRGRGERGGGEAREKGREAIELSTGIYISLVLLGRGWKR